MWGYVLSVAGLTVLCGLWVVFQRWMARMDPEAPGIEGRCGSCGQVCEVPDHHSKKPGRSRRRRPLSES